MESSQSRVILQDIIVLAAQWIPCNLSVKPCSSLPCSQEPLLGHMIPVHIHIHTHTHTHTQTHTYTHTYTGCHRRNGPNFGRVFLMLNYTDITQNTYIQSWTVTEIMAREVWNFDSCYTLTDYQIHIKTGRNMWFL